MIIVKPNCFEKTKVRWGIFSFFSFTNVETKNVCPIAYNTINSSGWWNHRNSIRLGWKPASTHGYADMFLYLHFNGRPFLPTPQRQLFVNTVKLGVANEFLLMAKPVGVNNYPSATVNGVQNRQSVLISNSIIFPAPKAGLVLAPYHGGDPKPYNPYIIGLQLNDY